MFALLPVKPDEMNEITIIANKQTRASIKAFQEIIQDQAMFITTCYHNLGFLGMVLRASDSDPLNNGKPFAAPIDPGPAPIDTTSTAAPITEVVCL